MISVLLIEHGYKKINSATSQIARSFWEKISNDKFNTVVLCSDCDDNLKSQNIIYAVKPSRFLKFVCKVLARIGLKDFVYFPDIASVWALNSRNTANQIVKNHDISYVHSIGKMFSSHLIALWLKKKRGIKWIAQFNDPWVDNNISSQSKLIRRLHEKLESSIAHNADIIIHNNLSIVNSWASRYGEDILNKIKIVPLTYNITELPPVDEIFPNEKYVISHIGSCYGTRTPLPFIRAAENFIKKYPQYEDKVVINFVGLIHKEAKEYVKTHNLNYIKIYEISSPENILHFYNESNLFLAIDLNIEKSMFFPSKLMTYYYFRRPILGVSNEGSVLESELSQTGHTNLSFDNIVGMEEYLAAAIHYKDANIQSFNKERWTEYTYENVYRAYCKIVTELLDVKQENI